MTALLFTWDTPTYRFGHGTVGPPETPTRARRRGQAQRKLKPPVLSPPGAEAADFPKSEQMLTCKGTEIAQQKGIIGTSNAQLFKTKHIQMTRQLI